MTNTINLETITPSQFNEFVGGSIFTATFVKKDGSIRVMNCRRQVKKHLKGGEMTWKPEKRGYVSVWDIQSEGYRVINLETLIELKANGKVIRNPKMERNANLEKIKDLALLIKKQDKDGARIANELFMLAMEIGK